MERASIELQFISAGVEEKWAISGRTILAVISTRNSAETAAVAHRLLRLIAYTRSAATTRHALSIRRQITVKEMKDIPAEVVSKMVPMAAYASVRSQ